MRKIVSIILVALLLTACQSSESEKVETREEYYVKLAKDVDSYDRLYEIIEEYSEDADEQQSFIKKYLIFIEDNDTVQEAILASEWINPEILFSILENHKWSNIHYTKRRNFLIETISKAKLNSDQELDIAKLGVETYQAALLYKPDVSCKALCYILNKETSKLNLKYYDYRELICMHASRDWDFEDRIKLINTNNEDIVEVFSKGKE